MAHQRIVDLKRRNFLAASVDQLLLATMQTEETILIDTADVAGSKPSVNERRPIEFRGIEIARHDRRGSHHDLAALAGGELAAVLPDDPHGIRRGNAARAWPRPAGEIRGDLCRFAGATMFQ